MRLLGNKCFNLILNAVWPRFCVSCDTEGVVFCALCRDAWEAEPPEQSTDHLAIFAYANPVVRKLICAWKYHYDMSAWEVLKEEGARCLPELRAIVAERKITVIVPLPLSPRRERERGFNQSRQIAVWLSKELGLPVFEVLERVHKKGHQAERSTAEREQAMKESPFLLKSGEELPDSILVVDDVWTTGSTLRSAFITLSDTKNVKIFCLTLAKG